MAAKRYFSVPLGRSADVAPENEGSLITEGTGDASTRNAAKFVAKSSSKEKRHFPKKRRFFHSEDDDGDPFGGSAPIDEEKLAKYSRGQNLKLVRNFRSFRFVMC